MSRKLSPAQRARKRLANKIARKETTGVRKRGMFGYVRSDFVFSPAYCPKRDGDLYWEDVSAFTCGDPPIGRRAIDMR